MSTLLERLVGDASSLGDANWKKPRHLLDAIAKRKKGRTSQRAFCPNGTGGGISNTCGKGININDKDQDFTGQILSGDKTIETRPSDSLKPYVGKVVGIVRTGRGKATLVGVMRVGKPKFYKTRKEFDADFKKHRVGPDSPHYIGPEGKFGYPLSEVKPVKPRTLDTKHIVARVIAKKVRTRELTVEFDLGGESPEEPHTHSRAFCPTGEGHGVDNSCGAGRDAPLHSPQFKEWFGGSKVVDAGGRPLLVYHGTSSQFEEFDPSASPVNDDGYMGAGSYFLDDDLGAHYYSLMASDNRPGEPRVVGAYLSIKNPFVISQSDHTEGMTRDEVIAWTDRKKAQGYDGVTNGHGEWVAFYPHQIKQVRVKQIQSRSDCGRDDDGRFTAGNKCGGLVDMPKEDPAGRLRYGNGVQTEAARKLYQMGSSEKKLGAFVAALGGDPKTTRVDINPPQINISVGGKGGEKMYHVDLDYGRARVYSTKDISNADASKIKKAAAEAFGGDKAEAFRVNVFRKADDLKKWHAENDAKYKAIEDKYKYSLLLPPHQRPKRWERSIDARHASLLAFAEARGCGQDADGKFSKGNTCAGGIAADAAAGAAKGAAVGAVSGFFKTFLPQGAVSGAATGAVAGAVKGIYDNQMRPTRVSARIVSLGMSDKGVAEIVKSLGGTPKSVASTTGRARLTVRIKGRDGKVTHVVDFTKNTLTIYPKKAAGRELSDSELQAVKDIAAANAPKQTKFAVKSDSLSYAKRIARNGFEVAANKAGLVIATAVVAGVSPSVPDAVIGTADLIFDTHFTNSLKRTPNAKRR